MHLFPALQTMHQETLYKNIVSDVLDFFIRQTAIAAEFGIKDVIIDVGFGFSKSMEENYILLNNLSIYKQLNKPILAGLSCKRMLYKPIDTTAEHFKCHHRSKYDCFAARGEYPAGA